MIKLQHPILGVREFSEQHAQNIMDIPVNIRGGWVEFNEDEDQTNLKTKDAVNDSTDTGDIKAEAKQKRNSKSGKARKQD